MPEYYELSTKLIRNNECYLEIITIDREPKSPLKSITKKKHFQNISSFKEFSNCNSNHCSLVLIKNNNHYYTIKDIPELLSVITSMGYKIDNNLSNLLKKKNFNIYISKN